MRVEKALHEGREREANVRLVAGAQQFRMSVCDEAVLDVEGRGAESRPAKNRIEARGLGRALRRRLGEETHRAARREAIVRRRPVSEKFNVARGERNAQGAPRAPVEFDIMREEGFAIRGRDGRVECVGEIPFVAIVVEIGA